jgi:hypothetical protein
VNDSEVMSEGSVVKEAVMPQETPIACTLGAGDLRARIASARELGERALVGVEVRDRRAVLRFHGERDAVDALVAAESECCRFFEFRATEDGDDTELEVRTPEGGEPLLRGLVAGVVAGWEGGLLLSLSPRLRPPAHVRSSWRSVNRA